MSQVTLQQVLQAREDRVLLQKQLLQNHRCPLVCFTMNIAGPVKTSPLIERGFRAGLQALHQALPPEAIRVKQIQYSVAGPQAFFSVDLNANRLKQLCTGIEEATPLGRLFDMDVIDVDGRKLERQGQRRCIVCGKPGRGCAAGRLHPVAELQSVTQQLLRDHFALSDREMIADLAVQSLMDEVDTTPKPGLVDRHNCGSHKDMTRDTFTASAQALRPYFAQCVEIGQNTANLPPHITFQHLRQAGLAAEQAMYQATNGVNTHKGAVFTMGILCGSLGRLWSAETLIPKTAELLKTCAAIGQAAETDFAAMRGTTAGERLYLQKGIRGIRGEAAAGLPSVSAVALPALTQGLEKGLSYNDAAACALLYLIAHVEDTNLYHRGGEQGASYAKEAVRALLRKNPWPSREQIEELDTAFIARRLSPGGCADLLAAACFVYRLSQITC